MSDDLTKHLRRLADHHCGVDLVERLAYAMQCQEKQRKALRQAADRIEALEEELRKTRLEGVATP
jgi:diphthamide synthase (EF-2-diphthine--ammonia ligase)